MDEVHSWQSTTTSSLRGARSEASATKQSKILRFAESKTDWIATILLTQNLAMTKENTLNFEKFAES
ncbi:hypothetical protein ACWIUD_05040 [Helicobacter sp. 23-1044]